MFELVFLGTSASAPSSRRNLPSLLIKHDEYRFLVDCGEGTQRQILQSGIGFKRLNRILITHGHLDHILGLAGLLSTYMRWEAIDHLDIYGGKSALDRIYDLLYGVVLRGAETPMPVNLIPVTSGVIFQEDNLTISAFPVKHRGPDCLGFILEEPGHRPFLPEKAEQLGVPSGPLRRDLVAGKEITLADGRKVSPEDVLGEYKPGLRLVVIGDTGETDSLVDIVRGADALVIEGTYLQEEADMAKQFSHLTVRQGAELAKATGVKQLIITHVSRRYRDKEIVKEATEIFPNAYLAHDLETFQIKQQTTE